MSRSTWRTAARSRVGWSIHSMKSSMVRSNRTLFSQSVSPASKIRCCGSVGMAPPPPCLPVDRPSPDADSTSGRSHGRHRPHGCSGTMTVMEFDLLGGLAARDGETELDLGGHKQRAVLAALVLEAGRPIPADRLIELVWGDESPDRVASSLQAYVSNLRRALEPNRRPRQAATVLVTRPTGYVLDVPRNSVDILRFEDLAGRGHAQLGPGTAEAARIAVPTLDEAITVWAGPLL